MTRVDLQTISPLSAQTSAPTCSCRVRANRRRPCSRTLWVTGLTQDIQVTLASIRSSLGPAAADGSLVYAGRAPEAYDTITSIAFKRTYYDKGYFPLTSEEIDVGPFSVQVRPVQIIRNRKIAVDDATVSIPILQEHVKVRRRSGCGQASPLVTEGGKREVSRASLPAVRESLTT